MERQAPCTPTRSKVLKTSETRARTCFLNLSISYEDNNTKLATAVTLIRFVSTFNIEHGVSCRYTNTIPHSCQARCMCASYLSSVTPKKASLRLSIAALQISEWVTSAAARALHQSGAVRGNRASSVRLFILHIFEIRVGG